MTARNDFTSTAARLVEGDRIFIDGAGVWTVKATSRVRHQGHALIRIETRQERGDLTYRALDLVPGIRRYDLAL